MAKKFVRLVSSMYVNVFVDPETGVEYATSNGGGITPLYNADGSLKIDPEYKKNL